MAGRKQNPHDAPKAKLNKETWQHAMYVFKYIKPYRKYFILGMFLLFVTSLTFMSFPYLMGQLVDIAQGASDMEFTLRDGAIALFILLVIQGVVSYFRVICFAIVSEKGLADLRSAIFDKLLSLPIFFFEGNKSGELISRIAADVEKLYAAFSITLAEFFRQVIILIIGITFLLMTTPKLALIMLATFPVIVIAAMVFGRYIRKLSKERQEKFAETSDVVSESVQSISMVKSFTNESLESARFGRSMDGLVTVALKYARGRALFAAFIVSVLFGGLFFVFWQGTNMIQNNTITAGNLISFVSYTAILGGAIAGLGNFYSEILGALGATERVRDILFETPEFDFTPNTSIKIEPISSTEIEFKNVNFNYPARPGIRVLKQFNMQIKSGETAALVGSSGAGKSTIVQLLLRFYEEYEGEITLGSKSIRDFDVQGFRRHFAFVSQDVILFGGSIRDNIGYGKPGSSDEEIIEAAKKANAYEFIKSFPEGLDTLIGERGLKLSGGQRQRVTIARAILRDPDILILDEATSNLDAESEGLVQEALDKLMQGRTSIVIAHRLSTIKDADQIFVLEHGQIAEQGKHDELMKNSGSYANLVKLQFDYTES